MGEYYLGEHDRLTCLFGYETHGGRRSILWNCPYYFLMPGGQGGQMLDEAFAAWKLSKRPFSTDEVLRGYWVKASDQGRLFLYVFILMGRSRSQVSSTPSVRGKARGLSSAWRFASGLACTNWTPLPTAEASSTLGSKCCQAVASQTGTFGCFMLADKAVSMKRRRLARTREGLVAAAYLPPSRIGHQYGAKRTRRCGTSHEHPRVRTGLLCQQGGLHPLRDRTAPR